MSRASNCRWVNPRAGDSAGTQGRRSAALEVMSGALTVMVGTAGLGSGLIRVSAPASSGFRPFWLAAARCCSTWPRPAKAARRNTHPAEPARDLAAGIRRRHEPDHREPGLGPGQQRGASGRERRDPDDAAPASRHGPARAGRRGASCHAEPARGVLARLDGGAASATLTGQTYTAWPTAPCSRRRAGHVPPAAMTSKPRQACRRYRWPTSFHLRQKS